MIIDCTNIHHHPSSTRIPISTRIHTEEICTHHASHQNNLLDLVAVSPQITMDVDQHRLVLSLDFVKQKATSFVDKLRSPWDDPEAIQAFIDTLEPDEQTWAYDTLGRQQRSLNLFTFLGAYTSSSPRVVQHQPSFVSCGNYITDAKATWAMLRSIDLTATLPPDQPSAASTCLAAMQPLLPPASDGMQAALLVNSTLPLQPDQRAQACSAASRLLLSCSSLQQLRHKIFHISRQPGFEATAPDFWSATATSAASAAAATTPRSSFRDAVRQ